MRELDYMAVKAADDSQKLNEFISQNESFIIKSASIAAKRYISKDDDGWSVALLAFTEAVKAYDFDKGSFYSFAKLVIRRRIIDYSRSQRNKLRREISVDPATFEAKLDEPPEGISIGLSVVRHVAEQEDRSLKLEIESINQLFVQYGFSFMDLTTCSPKAKKTKAACAKAVVYLLDNSVLINEMRRTKNLPIKIIEKNTKIPRKILERHRKYLIAAAEILYGDYPYLSEYLSYIREETGR